MPLVEFKRQFTPLGTCPSGYQYYVCSTFQTNWSGCCSIDPCSLEVDCPEDSQPGGASVSSKATISIRETTVILSSSEGTTSTGLLTEHTVKLSTGTVSSSSIAILAPAETTSSSVSVTVMLGESSSLAGDPSIETITDSPNIPGIRDESNHDIPAIAGASVGAVVLVALILILFFCSRRRRIIVRQGRRHEATPYIPEKHDLNDYDAISDSRKLDLDDVRPRSCSNPDDIKLRNSSSTGVGQTSRPPDLVPVLDSKPVSVVNELAASDPRPHPSKSFQKHSGHPVSPSSANNAKQANQSKNGVYITSSSLSDSDPTSWSRFTQLPKVNLQQGQEVSNLSTDSTNTHPATDNHPFATTGKAPATCVVGDEGGNQNYPVSRATSATITPAFGATTTPTIKIAGIPT